MSVKKKGDIVRVSSTDAKGKKKVSYFKIMEQEYKKSITIAIWEVDKEGNTLKDYPLVAFGAAKAKVISAFIEEISAFANK